MMEKFTKIIATIGPVSSSPEMIRKLRNAGMNAARINLSHGDMTSRQDYIDNIRNVSDDIAIILDTKGPEIRTGEMTNGSVELTDGQSLVLTNKSLPGTSEKITINFPSLKEIPIGARILIDDGLIESEVKDICDDGLVVKILDGGILGSNKTISIKGYTVNLPFLTEKDKDDILFAVQNNITIIAASFVRSKQDIRELRSFFIRHKADMMIISKIEHSKAVENMDDIIDESDGIMVARGDLGMDLPLEEVPGIQLEIINKCNRLGKPVIVATQMLESMREHPRPTRAEVSDVANAILQGSDAIMLSAETATGRYPVRAVEMMEKIALKYDIKVKGIYFQDPTGKLEQDSVARFIARSAYYASRDLNARAIMTPTESGFTARNVSRFRPKCPLIAGTRSRSVFLQLQLSWGVYPIYIPEKLALPDDMAFTLVLHSYEKGMVNMEDRIIITAGYKLLEKGGTNLMEIYTVNEVLARKKKG